MKSLFQIIIVVGLSITGAACTQLSTTNNACSVAGLYQNSNDCQSSTNSDCSMAVIENGGTNQVCWQKGRVSPNPTFTPAPTGTPGSSVTPTPTPSPNASNVVTTQAYLIYKLNATNGIHFSVTSVPNTPTFKIHVFSNNSITKDVDFNLTPTDDTLLYNNTVKLLMRQYYLVNYGNNNLSYNTSAAATISYSPISGSYIFENPGVWTGSQYIGFFDALIVWIRGKL